MREIKFRGKDLYNDQWHYGDLVHGFDENVFVGGQVYEGTANFSGVNPQTLGQFTGLHDKNGKEIYEGDVVLAKCNATSETKRQIKVHKCEVVYSVDFHGWRFSIIDMEPVFGATRRSTGYIILGNRGSALEVIGNIHEQEGD